MSLIAKPAPDFTAPTVLGDGTIDAEFSLSSLRGKYVVLFFYPLDFTFVCPTEILAFDRELDAFRDRGAEVVGVSVDSQFTHLAWKRTPVDQGGIGSIRYPWSPISRSRSAATTVSSSRRRAWPCAAPS